jgi:hypothetical protein
MSALFISPLLGYGILFEFVFAIITSLLAYKAFKVYRVIGTEKVRLFFLGFFQIAIAYLVLLGLNILTLFSVMSQFNPTAYIASNMLQASVPLGFSLYHFGSLIHLLLLMSGIVTLTYMTFNITNKNVFAIMQLLVFISLLSSYKILYLSHLLAIVCITYIILYYYKIYVAKENKNTLLVLLAFVFLLLGRAQFIFTHEPVFFILGHILELVAYILFARSLAPILRRRKS